TINRYWQQFFGVGIVKTVEDFGVQGERASHPELLDWLAVEFRESGWDVKHMHRLIVTSAAYRQSSKVTAEMSERDPENRLIARGSRTNTRLYPFTTRNEPTFGEEARSLAKRVMMTAGYSDRDRIDLAYRLVLARRPSEQESTILRAGVRRLRAEYVNDKESA